MSNARKLADNLPSEGQLGNRNLIINGAMTVAQRNTSVSEINYNDDGYWTTDRWKSIGSGSISGKINMSQDSDAPDGFKYSTKFAVHTADTAIAADHAWRVEQHIEAGSLRHLNYGAGSTTGKKITLSFWVKSNLTGNWSVGLYMDSTTGGTAANKENTQTYTINAANTWEYKTLTFIPNTDTNMNSTDNDHGMRLWFHLAAGSNYTGGSQGVWGGTSNRAAGHNVNFFSSTSNTWQFTGVQLEVGSQSTPFQHEPYETTLRKCQRYFYKVTGLPNGKHIGSVVMRDNQYFYGYPRSFPTPMRSPPALTYSGVRVYVGDHTNGFNTMTLAAAETDAFAFNGNAAGAVTAAETGHTGLLYMDTTSTNHVSFDAEL